MPIGTHQTEDA